MPLNPDVFKFAAPLIYCLLSEKCRKNMELSVKFLDFNNRKFVDSSSYFLHFFKNLSLKRKNCSLGVE